MAQGLIAGGTSYENQSLTDIIEDIKRWIEHSREVQRKVANMNTTLSTTSFYLELSSQVQQLIEKDFKGRSPSETFAGTKIDLVGKGGEEGGIKGLQVDRLGAIFADESIGVFISAPHPGGVWRWKEEWNVIEGSRNLSMLCEFHTSIRSDGTNEFGREVAKELNHPVTHMCRSFLWDFQG